MGQEVGICVCVFTELSKEKKTFMKAEKMNVIQETHQNNEDSQRNIKLPQLSPKSARLNFNPDLFPAHRCE